LSRLRVRTPKRVIVPLSNQEVARFWAGFRASRDLAIVGLMLFDGLRSGEVRTLDRDDLLLSEAQLRVHGKGGKPRCLPLRPKSCNSWITTCFWSGPPTAVLLCSSISKALPEEGASRPRACAPCSAITANSLGPQSQSYV
jgi:site-specific recombinase XerC